MEQNILKIDVLTYECQKCNKQIEVWGKTKEETTDKMIRHFYEHDYPVWRQPTSIENDPTFEEYKKIFPYTIIHEENQNKS